MFDWEVPHKCEFGVPARYVPAGEIDCGEPAPYYVWWDDEGKDGMWLCQEHFDYVKAATEAIEEEEA